MVEIGVRKQLLLFPHGLVDGFGDREQHGVAHFVSELFRPALDHFIARIAVFIDRVAKAHDLVFARQHAKGAFNRFLGRGETFDHFHRRFVGTAVQRAAQGADGSGDAGIQVGQCRCTHPCGEGRSVEFVFSVEDQRHVHHFDVQLARFLAMQQVQEVATDARLVGHAVDALAVVAEAIPVAHDRRERGEQAVGDIALHAEIFLRLDIAQERAPGAHHVHRMGVGGDAFEHFFQGLGQVTQFAQLVAVRGQFCLGWQFTVQQQVGDFFKLGVSGQFAYVVATVGQAGAGLAHGGQCSLPGDLATQASTTQYFCFSHVRSPIL